MKGPQSPLPDALHPIWLYVEELHRRVGQCERSWTVIELTVAEHAELSERRENSQASSSISARLIALQGVYSEVTESFLLYAAQASLLLFPVAPRKSDRTGRMERGEGLRVLLGFEPEDLLSLQDRSLRDSFVHIDERLDRAVAEHGLGVGLHYFQRQPSRFVPEDRIARIFGMVDLFVSVFGRRHELRPIRQDLALVRQRLDLLRDSNASASQ